MKRRGREGERERERAGGGGREVILKGGEMKIKRERDKC